MVAQLKEQRRTGSGQIAFHRHQYPLCGRTLVSCHSQNGPHSTGNVDGTAGSVQGADAAHLVHVRHDEHGAFGALGHGIQTAESAPHLVGLIHTHRRADVSRERVEDQQPGVLLQDALLQPRIVEGQCPFFFIDDLDAGAVGSRAFQPRFDGVGNAVLRSLVQDVDGLPGGFFKGKAFTFGEQRRQ